MITNQIDVIDREGMRRWIAEVDEKHPIDMVVANAGVTESTLGIRDLEEAAYKVRRGKEGTALFGMDFKPTSPHVLADAICFTALFRPRLIPLRGQDF